MAKYFENTKFAENYCVECDSVLREVSLYATVYVCLLKTCSRYGLVSLIRKNQKSKGEK